MGKAEVGTPKYLANKMKAKGLQKLRWYCQMCQKQCRDENGFKCHTTSESHQRQLLLFADNSRRYIDAFSHEFATGYLELLRRRFSSKRINANKVYQEYIADRNHLHMNATRWLSLTGFVQYLGKTGKCVVDETEKGWYITYIDRDPDTIAAQEKVRKKEKMDKDDEERLMEFIEKQVERGSVKGEYGEASSSSSSAVTADQPVFTEFIRENEEDKIKLNLNISNVVKSEPVFLKPMNLDKMEGKRSINSDDDSRKDYKRAKSVKEDFKKPTALDEIMKNEEYKKEKANRKDYWLAEGIVVKLIAKSLGEKYYKEKGVVIEVIDKYRAKIKLIETGEKIKVDQAHLETVIPAVGKNILVLNGGYRGHKAILKGLDEKNFCVSVEIASGPLKGRVVNHIKYEDISKLN